MEHALTTVLFIFIGYISLKYFLMLSMVLLAGNMGHFSPNLHCTNAKASEYDMPMYMR